MGYLKNLKTNTEIYDLFVLTKLWGCTQMQKIFGSLILIFFTSPLFAQNLQHRLIQQGMDETTRLCYARSMIGFDSVVNSRVGLNPENSIHITQNTFPNNHPLNKIELLTIIMNAYLWTDSPHTYSVITFSNCISKYGTKHE